MSAPGPDLDARLAEAMGHKVCRDQLCNGCDAEWFIGFRPTDLWCPGENGMRYSTDPAAAISAAEEMRKAGRIRFWLLTSAQGDSPCFATVSLSQEVAQPTQRGDTPAHALTLALLAALEAR